MRIFLLTLFLLFSRHSLCADLCTEIFAKKNQASLSELESDLLQLIQEKPNYLESNPSILNHYFKILDLLNNLSKNYVTFSPEFRNRVSLSFDKKYSVPQVEKDFLLFLQNHLHFLASQSAWVWKKGILEEWTGHSLSGSMLMSIQAVFDSFFTLGTMNDSDPDINYIKDTLLRPDLRSYPWEKTIILLEAWHRDNAVNPTPSHFFKWLEEHPELPTLDFKDLQRLSLALLSNQKKPAIVFCCKSGSPCKQCPHNRRWLK